MIISWCLNPCWRSFMILPSLMPPCQLVFLEIALRCGRITISHGQVSCLMTSRSCMIQAIFSGWRQYFLYTDKTLKNLYTGCAVLLVRASSQQERNINLLDKMISHFLGKNICNHFAQLLFFCIRNLPRLAGCLIQIWIFVRNSLNCFSHSVLTDKQWNFLNPSIRQMSQDLLCCIFVWNYCLWKYVLNLLLLSVWNILKFDIINLLCQQIVSEWLN